VTPGEGEGSAEVLSGLDAGGGDVLAQVMEKLGQLGVDQVAVVMLAPAVLLGGWFLPLIQNILIAYAGLKSFRAIQSPDPEDDKQWLTFWLLYSLFDLVCFVLDLFLWVIPFYGGLKCAILIFLGVLGGASRIYPVLEPLLLQGDEVAKKYEPILEQHLKKLKEQAEDKLKKLQESKQEKTE